MELKEFFKMELEAKKAGEWFIFSGEINGVHVAIKQIRGNGIYQQILRVGNSGINYGAGHTLSTVKEFKDQITKLIEGEME